MREFLRSPGNLDEGLWANWAVLMTHQRPENDREGEREEGNFQFRAELEYLRFPIKFFVTYLADSFTSLYLITSHWTSRTFGPQCLNKLKVSASNSFTPANTVKPLEDNLRVNSYPSPVSEPDSLVEALGLVELDASTLRVVKEGKSGRPSLVPFSLSIKRKFTQRLNSFCCW